MYMYLEYFRRVGLLYANCSQAPQLTLPTQWSGIFAYGLVLRIAGSDPWSDNDSSHYHRIKNTTRQ